MLDRIKLSENADYVTISYWI